MKPVSSKKKKKTQRETKEDEIKIRAKEKRL